MNLNVAIVGCGLIGRRCAAVARELGHRIAVVADIVPARAEETAEQNGGCEWVSNWRKVVERPDVDLVVVCTVNKFLAPITIAAAENGKHILCEKPLGRNDSEAEQMVNAAQKTGVVLKTGFNHRHHPAIQRAFEVCRQGTIGPLMLIRATYGHGGRPGYDKEWRADVDSAGGGELLDQGVHVVDLCRWFMGDFIEAIGAVGTCYWDLPYWKPQPGAKRRWACASKIMALLCFELRRGK